MAFQQTLRLALRAHALPAVAAASVLGLATSSARLEEAPAKKEEEAPAKKEEEESKKQPLIDYIGVFVTSQGAEQLKKTYPTKFATDESGRLVVVLQYNPSDKEKDAFAPIMGSDAIVRVNGYVEDDHTQAVLVSVTTAQGDPLEFANAKDAEPVHLTLSSSAEAPQGHSHVLLERLRASDKLKFLAEEVENSETEWTGELPAFKSAYFPLYSPFPAVQAKVAKAETAETPLELKGTVCLLSTYDRESESCETGKPECGFCKFMKAGPCGVIFTRWEACLDKCKEQGLEFVDHCREETLGLRDCVDANPDYYAVLNESSEDEEPKKETA